MTRPEPGLVWTVVRNAVSQTGGRVLLALLRFAAALIVLRATGLSMFGQYSLILSFVLIAEWLADFGQTDIAVRDMAANPPNRGHVLASLAAVKLMLGILAAFLMWVVVALLGYPEPLVRSSAIAGVAVVCYAGALVYRAQFRAALAMERDVGAELASACALLAGVWVATRGPASLEVLTLCYVLSRAVYLVAAAILAGGRPRWNFGGALSPEMRRMSYASLPLGLAGLLVCGYDAMDALALAHWSTSGEIGVFSAAMRTVVLAAVAVQSLVLAVFPVLAAQWMQDRPAFVRTTQATLDAATVIGGAVFCAMYVGAPGIAGLLQREPGDIASVIQLLSFAMLARVIVTVMGPMVVISGRQIHTLWMTGMVVVAKALALAWLVPRAGALGAAAAYIVSEIAVGLVPTVLLCQHVAAVRLNWALPLRAVGLAVAVAFLAQTVHLTGSLLQGALAMAVFLALAAATGVVRLRELRQIYVAVVNRRGPQPATLDR